MTHCETFDCNQRKTATTASADAPAPRGTRWKITPKPVQVFAILRKKVYFFLRKSVAFCAKSVILSNTSKQGVRQMCFFKSWHGYVAVVIVLGAVIAHALGVC